MPEENGTDKGRIKLGMIKAWNPLDAEWKRESISNPENSGIGIDEKEKDADIQEAENKINAITKRTNHFTTFVLIAMTLVSTGILLNRGSICVSK